MAKKVKLLTWKEVNEIIDSFLAHIAKHWDKYKDNLPQLARTLMFYNEFSYGIRYLPEYEGNNDFYFNPRYPLTDDLKKYFGRKFTLEIGELVCCAWPLRSEQLWRGYEEPANPMDSVYKGFQTAKEFPEQKQFLDTIRKHSRIKFGIRLMEKKTLENFVMATLPANRKLRKRLVDTFVRLSKT